MNAVLRCISTLAVGALFSMSVFAGGHMDSKASGKGQVNPVDGSNNPTCIPGTVTTADPCVIFSSSGNTGTWENLDSNANVVAAYNLIEVPTTQSVTFQLANSGVTFGSFLCGSDPTMITALHGFCTNIPDDGSDTVNPDLITPFLSSNYTLNSKNQVSFSFIPGSSLPSDWVFLFDAPGTSIVTGGGGTTVPEPATLMLLGFGLLGGAAFKRRIPGWQQR